MLDMPARPRFLAFENRSFSDDEIASLLARPSIRGLTFTDCAIGDAAVRALCALPRLERLWLSGSAVTDAVMPDIARVPLLDWLVLDHTGIGNAGVAALAGHARLQHLSLRHTEAGDACVPHIVSIARLAFLDAKASAITRGGLLALAAHPTLTLCADDSRPPELEDAFLREQRRLASRTPAGFVPGAGEQAAALAALHGFWDGISAWETRLALDQAADPHFSDWRPAQRRAVFARFCTQKHSTSGQADTGSFGIPPTYAQQRIIDVEWLSARKLCVYTVHNQYLQSRFVLVKTGGVWLLDHMQNLFEGWKTGYL